MERLRQMLPTQDMNGTLIACLGGHELPWNLRNGRKCWTSECDQWAPGARAKRQLPGPFPGPARAASLGTQGPWIPGGGLTLVLCHFSNSRPQTMDSTFLGKRKWFIISLQGWQGRSQEWKWRGEKRAMVSQDNVFPARRSVVPEGPGLPHLVGFQRQGIYN